METIQRFVVHIFVSTVNCRCSKCGNDKRNRIGLALRLTLAELSNMIA